MCFYFLFIFQVSCNDLKKYGKTKPNRSAIQINTQKSIPSTVIQIFPQRSQIVKLGKHILNVTNKENTSVQNFDLQLTNFSFSVPFDFDDSNKAVQSSEGDHEVVRCLQGIIHNSATSYSLPLNFSGKG